jgi:hypothetical protein
VSFVIAPAAGNPLVDPGRFLLAGDWHGDAAWARQVIRHAPVAADGRRLIIQLGDFGVWPGRTGVRYLDAVAAALAETNAVCLFIDGNHEDFPQLVRYPIRSDGLREVRPRLFHLPRGTRWSWQGIRFLALGGATSLDRPWRTAGVDWWPDEELTRADLDRAIDGGACDVMLTHDAPSGVDVPGLPPASTWEPAEIDRANRHRDLLHEVVDAVRPARLVHGHFHSRYDAELVTAGGHRLSVTGLANEWTGPDGCLELDFGAAM